MSSGTSEGTAGLRRTELGGVRCHEAARQVVSAPSVLVYRKIYASKSKILFDFPPFSSSRFFVSTRRYDREVIIVIVMTESPRIKGCRALLSPPPARVWNVARSRVSVTQCATIGKKVL